MYPGPQSQVHTPSLDPSPEQTPDANVQVPTPLECLGNPPHLARPQTELLVSYKCTHPLGKGTTVHPELQPSPQPSRSHSLHTLPPLVFNPPASLSALPPICMPNLTMFQSSPSSPHFPIRLWLPAGPFASLTVASNQTVTLHRRLVIFLK